MAPAVLADLREIRLERVARVAGTVAVDQNQGRACKMQEEEKKGAGGRHGQMVVDGLSVDGAGCEADDVIYGEKGQLQTDAQRVAPLSIGRLHSRGRCCSPPSRGSAAPNENFRVGEGSTSDEVPVQFAPAEKQRISWQKNSCRGGPLKRIVGYAHAYGFPLIQF